MDVLRTSIGRPPTRVSHGKTVHRTVLPTILRFASLGDFALCGETVAYHL